MKTYEGGRGLAGAQVTVDGAPLDPRFDVKLFSKMGYEWTYEGDGPRQLALALLCDLTLTDGVRYGSYQVPYEKNGVQVATTVGVDQFFAEGPGCSA